MYLHMTDVTMRVSAALCVGRLGCQADCGLERDVKVVIVVVKVGAGDKRVSNSISHRHTSTTLPNAIVQVAFFTHKTNPALCINRILIWQRHALYIVVSKNDMLFRCHQCSMKHQNTIRWLIDKVYEEYTDCSLNHANCSLNHANCSLNHSNRSLNHANRSLNHANCSLNQV